MAYSAIAGLILAAVGAAASASSAEEQAKAQANAANYQAQVAANNQIIANETAARTLQQGQQMSQIKEMQTGQQMAAVRAAAGASGLDPNAPGTSATRVQSDVETLGSTDALTIRNNAALAAWGYQTQGSNFSAQAGLLEQQSSQALTAGNLNAFSSIINAGASVSSKWSQLYGGTTQDTFTNSNIGGADGFAGLG